MNALRIGIACLVAAVWAVVYLASVFNPNISAPAELSGVMLAVVTWLFGRAFREGLKQRAHDTAEKVLEKTTVDAREADRDGSYEDA